ncbi:MAG: hypothetical protein IPN94_16920, partial [Sphingobacteriales bacterium]|nr:hypothetical protein [Sphingobacteriales bacterium]
NVSDISDQEICQGYSGTLAFPLEAYNASYGPAPTPAADYTLAYVLTDNSDNILATEIMGAPFNTVSNTPSFMYSGLAAGTYRMYEIIYRTIDGPLIDGPLPGTFTINTEVTTIDGTIAAIELTIGTCLESAYSNIYINPAPIADAPSDVTECFSYTLPALTVGNYFTGTGGTGTALFAGNIIASTQTIYVYAETGTTPNCTDEEDFSVTINNCATSTIGNYVWVDLNNDGIQNDGLASGVNGVVVNLLDALGNPVLDSNGNPITTVTANDSNGNPGFYQFTGLAPGNYIVQVVLPVGATFASNQNGSAISSSSNTSNTDSNIANTATGQTGIITIGIGETINSVDVSLAPPACTAGTATAPAVVCSAASGLSTIDLASLLTGEDAGGTWTDDANGNTVGATLDPNGVAAGVYTFTYTVVNGTCTDSETVTVRINQTPTFTTATNCTGANGTLTINATGGSGIYLYSYEDGAFTANDQSPSYPNGTVVTVVIRDFANPSCEYTADVTVNCTCPTYAPAISATLNGNIVTLGQLAAGICSGSDVEFTITDPNGSVSSYSWIAWSGCCNRK